MRTIHIIIKWILKICWVYIWWFHKRLPIPNTPINFFVLSTLQRIIHLISVITIHTMITITPVLILHLKTIIFLQLPLCHLGIFNLKPIPSRLLTPFWIFICPHFIFTASCGTDDFFMKFIFLVFLILRRK